MPISTQDSIPALLVRDVPRDLVMAVEEALTVGAQRAFIASTGMDKGHLPHALGQLRHFHMNESFHRALEIASASPSPVKGNSIVTGRTGIFALARFNIPQGIWVNGRRSRTRRQMSAANKAIEPLVIADLLDEYVTPSAATAFFVACFSGSLIFQPDVPVSVQIAVPNRDMTGWLFREPLKDFLQRYEEIPTSQEDLVTPVLKKSKKKSDEGIEL
ncbi:MAG: alpha/beta hydrolase [Pseudohongiella sp.]|nr:alpha/beta hydrolase [Pseudohongiella sp.]